MPENIRALIIILVLAMSIFAFAGQSTHAIFGTVDFTRRRNLWLALTTVALLSLNFWVYVLFAIPLLLYARRRENNPSAMFFFILFALPMDLVQVPGFGLVQSLFELSHPRLLELFILLPVFLYLRRQSDYIPIGRNLPDKLFVAFLLLTGALYFRDFITVTDALRHIIYLFLDAFLPYAVISRSLKNLQSFRDAVMSFVLANMILALVAGAEFYKKWLLYDTLIVALQRGEEITTYLARDGMLRVTASAGHPIVLGFLMMVSMGLYIFIARSIGHKFLRRAGMLLLVAGLFVPLSRGPWVGAAVLMVVYFATSRYATRSLIGLGLASVLALSLLAVLPGGEKVINLLPFVGTTENENIGYRQNLLVNSMIVIQHYPWFGSTDFLKTPELEAMRQGQGIIDIVNSYIAIALKSGVTGLGLFVGFFGFTIMGILRAMRTIADKDSEEYLLGRVLVATLLAITVTIVTVSSILFIPIVYWSVAGLGMAYVQMIRNSHVRT
jgi:O-antigen ligase